MQRGGSPTSRDRILASRLGLAGIEALLDGKTAHMVGIQDNKVVLNTMKDAIEKTKPLREDLLQLVEVLNT